MSVMERSGFLFRAADYGPEVSAILALDGDGERLMPLVMERCSSEAARERIRVSRAPQMVLSGLYVYFSCFEEAHALTQDIETAEASYWHAIIHRQEPNAENAAYWFREVGVHPIFLMLAVANPFEFIDICELALQQPGYEMEALRLAIPRIL